MPSQRAAAVAVFQQHDSLGSCACCVRSLSGHSAAHNSWCCCWRWCLRGRGPRAATLCWLAGCACPLPPAAPPPHVQGRHRTAAAALASPPVVVAAAAASSFATCLVLAAPAAPRRHRRPTRDHTEDTRTQHHQTIVAHHRAPADPTNSSSAPAATAARRRPARISSISCNAAAASPCPRPTAESQSSFCKFVHSRTAGSTRCRTKSPSTTRGGEAPSSSCWRQDRAPARCVFERKASKMRPSASQSKPPMMQSRRNAGLLAATSAATATPADCKAAGPQLLKSSSKITSSRSVERVARQSP